MSQAKALLNEYITIAIEESKLMTSEMNNKIESEGERIRKETEELKPNENSIKEVEKKVDECQGLYNDMTSFILKDQASKAKYCIDSWKKYVEYKQQGGEEKPEEIKKLIEMSDRRITMKLIEQSGFRNLKYLKKSIKISKLLGNILDGTIVNMESINELIPLIDGVDEMLGSEYVYVNKYTGLFLFSLD